MLLLASSLSSFKHSNGVTTHQLTPNYSLGTPSCHQFCGGECRAEGVEEERDYGMENSWGEEVEEGRGWGGYYVQEKWRKEVEWSWVLGQSGLWDGEQLGRRGRGGKRRGGYKVEEKWRKGKGGVELGAGVGCENSEEGCMKW